MSYLIYVAIFGEVAVIFLWVRDARIYFLTGFQGYRKAAYWGIVYGALATFGVACTMFVLELLGLGLILAALYMQGRIDREKIWSNEGTMERLLGSVKRQKANMK
jgi:hypothetical protein